MASRSLGQDLRVGLEPKAAGVKPNHWAVRMNAASGARSLVTIHDRLCMRVFAPSTNMFAERFDDENRSHGISDLQKAAEEGFSNLVFERLPKTASRPGRLTRKFGTLFDPPV
jgi:hypothetical protein